MEEVASKQRNYRPGEEVEESRRTHVQRRKADALGRWMCGPMRLEWAAWG